VRTRSNREHFLSAAVAVLVALLTGPVAAQETDFFEEGASLFQAETITGASKHAEAPTETPATATILTRDDIERYGFRTLADVLNYASLGDFTNNDRRYDFVGGRGLFSFEDFNTRILVMLDGHPLNEPWNNFAGVGREMLVPMDVVERIEITYGPSSLLYGGYSLYGLVNVVTRTAESLSGAGVRLSGGSWGTREVAATYGTSGSSGEGEGSVPWEVVAAGAFYRSDGESVDLPPIEQGDGSVWGGKQRDTDFERSPSGFLYAKRGDWTILGRTGYRKHGEPLAPYDADYGSDRNSVQDRKSFGELRYDHAIGPHFDVSARLFLDDYHYREHEAYTDSESYPGHDGYDYVLSSDNRDAGGEARVAYHAGAHFLTVGGEYRWRDVDQAAYNVYWDGGNSPDSPGSSTVKGHLGVAYLQEEWRPFDELTLLLGGNWADTEPGGTKALPRVAMIYKPSPRLAVKALWGKGFRPPSIYETSYNDYLTQIPNPSLRSEEISSSELSVLWSVSPSLSIQAYGFNSRLRGLVQGVEIMSVDDIQGGVVGPSGDPNDLVGMLQFQAAGDVTSRGGGLSARARMGDLHSYGNVSYAKARLDPRGGAGETDLAASSNWLANAGVSYDFGDLTASISARYVGSQPLQEDHGEGNAGDFVDANLRLLWKTVVVYPVRLYVDVWNVTDEKGSFSASSVYVPARSPIEGRKIVVGTEVRF
jgi:iron complex outermembrane receptor protein